MLLFLSRTSPSSSSPSCIPFHSFFRTCFSTNTYRWKYITDYTQWNYYARECARPASNFIWLFVRTAEHMQKVRANRQHRHTCIAIKKCIYIRWTISLDNKNRRSTNWMVPVFVTILLVIRTQQQNTHMTSSCRFTFYFVCSHRSSTDNGWVHCPRTIGKNRLLSEPIHFSVIFGPPQDILHTQAQIHK